MRTVMHLAASPVNDRSLENAMRFHQGLLSWRMIDPELQASTIIERCLKRPTLP